jgi:ATP-dependent helicase/nuclease subunit A
VVFLVDTTSSPSDTQRPKLIRLPGGVMVWAGKKADDPAVVAAGRTAMLAEIEDEYRRLLYVAMTRAADRLIVGGCMPGNANSVRKYSWYDLVRAGLVNSGLQEQTIERPDGPIKRYTRADELDSAKGVAATPQPKAEVELPPWLRIDAPPEARSDKLLRPSDSAEDETRRVRSGEPIQMRGQALRRGTLVHRLLQSLPDLPSDRRQQAALNYLARNAGDWAVGDQRALASGVVALIEDSRFAPVFGPGSRPEVSIAGRLERPGQRPTVVSGQIDRLVITPTEVLIIDYKTNYGPPSVPGGAPQAYVRQLALYRAVLGKLYPHLPIRAALLWTETPELMEISASALDAQLASIISA